MAYAKTRSLNQELNEGQTDGRFKKVITDRAGAVEMTTWEQRKDLANRFGIHEAQEKVLPGSGEAVRTPYTVSTDGALDEVN